MKRQQFGLIGVKSRKPRSVVFDLEDKINGEGNIGEVRV